MRTSKNISVMKWSYDHAISDPYFFLLDSDLKKSEVTQRFESFWRTQIFIDFIYFSFVFSSFQKKL